MRYFFRLLISIIFFRHLNTHSLKIAETCVFSISYYNKVSESIVEKIELNDSKIRHISYSVIHICNERKFSDELNTINLSQMYALKGRL